MGKSSNIKIALHYFQLLLFLQIASPLTFGASVQPVQLVSAERIIEASYPAVVSGWGVTSVSLFLT